MEKNNKNQISTMLLAIGVIFIMIAGSIFVTTAWGYLSETGKRLILISFVAGLYVASWKLRVKGVLTKTEHALYYLAAVGTGFIAVSFLGGWNTIYSYMENADALDTMNNADKAMWGFGATAIAIAYRFFKERRTWDFGILIFIFINMFGLVFDANINNIAGVIPLIAFTLLATFQYVNTEYAGYRIAQSIGLVVTNLFFIDRLYELLYDGIATTGNAEKWWCFAAFVINLGITVVLERDELIWMTLVYNWVMTFVQVITGFDEWSSEAGHIIVPFAFTTALGFLVMWIREREERYGKLSIVHGIMAVFEFIMYLLIRTTCYAGNKSDIFALAAMCTCIMIAFISEIVDSMLEADIAKSLLKTFTLLFSEFAAFFFTIVIAPDHFGIEFMSVFMGVGIVLLGRIWYDKIIDIHVAQFVFTCITLFILLLHNIAVEELANLMFLGVVGIVILIVAAIKNRKEYVIASSATLALLVIYLTRQFWLSIAWWVYLFVAGVILVGIAVKKERES